MASMLEFMHRQWRANKGFVLFLGLMFVFRSAIADWTYIPSSSMNPTLVAGDRVLVNKLAYSLRVPFTRWHIKDWGAVARGDVIIFDSPADEVTLIKRVVAVAGDVVQMRDNTLVINGKPVERSLTEANAVLQTENGALPAEIWTEQWDFGRVNTARIPAYNRSRDLEPMTVPSGHVMVMGDSRDNSNDSRYIGFIDETRITGRAAKIVMSHDPDHYYLPRSNRWWLELHS